MFSATFDRRVERLARRILDNPVRIVVGEVGEANKDVTQFVQIFADADQKKAWLRNNMGKLTDRCVCRRWAVLVATFTCVIFFFEEKLPPLAGEASLCL